MIAGHLPELLIVLVIGLIFFGPKRLPEVGEALGKGIRDFKKGMSHITESYDASGSHEIAAPISLVVPSTVDSETLSPSLGEHTPSRSA